MSKGHADGAETLKALIRRTSPAAAGVSPDSSAVCAPLIVSHAERPALPTRAPPLTQQMDRALENWFVSAILPHQAALTGFLKRICKSSSDVPDLRQETYIRVCESAARSRPRVPKAFLFATARNLAIDRLRRERLVSVDPMPNGVPLEVSIDELTPERRLAARQELQQLTRAFASLPERTRSVIWLRRVAGLSQREAAASLGIDEGALEGHMTRGMRRLAQAVVPERTREEDRQGELITRKQTHANGVQYGVSRCAQDVQRAELSRRKSLVVMDSSGSDSAGAAAPIAATGTDDPVRLATLVASRFATVVPTQVE